MNAALRIVMSADLADLTEQYARTILMSEFQDESNQGFRLEIFGDIPENQFLIRFKYPARGMLKMAAIKQFLCNLDLVRGPMRTSGSGTGITTCSTPRALRHYVQSRDEEEAQIDREERSSLKRRPAAPPSPKLSRPAPSPTACLNLGWPQGETLIIYVPTDAHGGSLIVDSFDRSHGEKSGCVASCRVVFWELRDAFQRIVDACARSRRRLGDGLLASSIISEE